MDQLSGFLKAIKPKYEDDSIDRLNYYYTVFLMLIFAITLSAKQYVGEPIQCWVPAQFKKAWEEYTERFCFVENTYYVNMQHDIPDDDADRENLQISYYQWVPFVLALQALMFHFPHIIWKLLNWQSGLNVRGIITMATDLRNNPSCATNERKKNVTTIASHISDACSIRKAMGKVGANPITIIFSCGKGIYVTALYLVIKLLFIANVIGQFFILNRFVGSKYKFWGVEILYDLFTDQEWDDSGHFPRVTLCDVKVREMGNLHNWTVQCVLMINMFHEKIFLFLWFWFLIVAVMTILNFTYWLISSILPSQREIFLRKYITVKTRNELKFDATDANITRFVKEIGADGTFILRLMSDNAGEVITTDVTQQLFYERFPDTRDQKRKEHSR